MISEALPQLVGCNPQLIAPAWPYRGCATSSAPRRSGRNTLLFAQPQGTLSLAAELCDATARRGADSRRAPFLFRQRPLQQRASLPLCVCDAR